MEFKNDFYLNICYFFYRQVVFVKKATYFVSVFKEW